MATNGATNGLPQTFPDEKEELGAPFEAAHKLEFDGGQPVQHLHSLAKRRNEKWRNAWHRLCVTVAAAYVFLGFVPLSEHFVGLYVKLFSDKINQLFMKRGKERGSRDDH